MKQDLELEEQLAEMFPYKPYNSQLKLSMDIYNSLQSQQKQHKNQRIKALIVQSPTGTGKTYALLVATIKWLQQHPNNLQPAAVIQQKQQNREWESQPQSQLPAWLTKPKDIKQKQLMADKQQKIKQLKTIAEFKGGKNNKYIAKSINSIDSKNQADHKIEWEDFDDDQNIANNTNINNNSNNNDTDGTNYGQKRNTHKNRIILKIQQQQQNQQCLPKIIFASRTHSQLSQVIQSINKLQLPIRAVSLASKDHLCVHPQIQKNKTHQKCQYLLSHQKCPYYHQQKLDDFMNLSIQQAKKLGQLNSLCAYYGSKNLTPIADVICLPYISILNPQIRQKLNININNAIIIFDEAHNLIEQQLNMKSPEISYGSLQRLYSRIQIYKQKYGNRMNKTNLELITHLQQIITSFMKVIQQQYHKANQYNNTQNYIRLSKIQFFIRLNLTQIRLSRIKNYIALSNFDQKLAYACGNSDGVQMFPMSILTSMLDLLTQLTSMNNGSDKNNRKCNTVLQKHNGNNGDSSIVLIKVKKEATVVNSNNKKSENNINTNINTNINNSTIKILCLQPTQIRNIIHKSRLTILAGGTMQPIQQFKTIFAECCHLHPSTRIHYKFHQYQHVIKHNQCTVYVIGRDFTQHPKQIKFTHQNVMKAATNTSISISTNTNTNTNTNNNIASGWLHIIKQVQTIISKIIRQYSQNNSGTVIFIQNYASLQYYQSVFTDKLCGIPVYYDSRDPNYNAFEKYSQHILHNNSSNSTGNKQSAILVSVMGGKLSQGINFSDKLARCIIVLGLPYPNLKAAQMIQKMRYLDNKMGNKYGVNFINSGKLSRQDYQCISGQEYYENCCIKTLNQTIGRGIRHVNDYANIFLVDSRFAATSLKLSEWLTKRIKILS